MWNNVDFVTAWKTTSIALTGAFGILGLLTEFKDKDKKKITKWGYVSLVGILISTCCGIVAQLQESSDSATKALAVAQTSSNTLRQIKRLVSPIGTPAIAMRFEITCDKPEFLFNDFCKSVLATQRSISKLDILKHPKNADRLVQLAKSPIPWGHWPYKNDIFMQVGLNFFRDRADADRFWNSNFEEPEPDLRINTSAFLQDRRGKKLELEVYPTLIRATMRFPPVKNLSATDKITSFEDLDGATLIVTTPLLYLFSVATPQAIRITNPQGQSVQVVGPFEKKSTDRQVLTEDPWGYRYYFPKSTLTSPSNGSSASPTPIASNPPAE